MEVGACVAAPNTWTIRVLLFISAVISSFTHMVTVRNHFQGNQTAGQRSRFECTAECIHKSAEKGLVVGGLGTVVSVAASTTDS